MKKKHLNTVCHEMTHILVGYIFIRDEPVWCSRSVLMQILTLWSDISRPTDPLQLQFFCWCHFHSFSNGKATHPVLCHTIPVLALPVSKNVLNEFHSVDRREKNNYQYPQIPRVKVESIQWEKKFDCIPSSYGDVLMTLGTLSIRLL